MILNYHYQDSTRLRSQNFDICLENKPQVGTPIRRNLEPGYQEGHKVYLLGNLKTWSWIQMKIAYHLNTKLYEVQICDVSLT